MLIMLLETHRICVRNLRDADFEQFYNYRKQPSVANFQGFDIMDKEACRKFIESQKDNQVGASDEWQQFGIALISTDHLIGDCAIKLDRSINNSAQIGCTINPEYQRQGYAKETVLHLIEFLFDLCNVRRIVETTDAENQAAIKLMESLHFRKEGHFLENTYFKGRWGSECQFALLKTEWEKQ